MTKKTTIEAQPDRQDLLITKEFDLPVQLLYKAYAEPGFVEQWMSTKVLKLDNRKHGSYQFQTRDPQGNVVFSANGTIHEVVENEKITRTFEMENAPFDVQLEFLQFHHLSNGTSKLTMYVVYKSVELRDQQLKLPFASGLNLAHNRLQDVIGKQIA